MIDLSEILYRAHEVGDVDDPKNIPSLAGSSTTPILLDSIKFRAHQHEDAEEEEEE